RDEPGERAQKRRLPSTRGAEEANDLAGSEVERHRVEGRPGGARVAGAPLPPRGREGKRPRRLGGRATPSRAPAGRRRRSGTSAPGHALEPQHSSQDEQKPAEDSGSLDTSPSRLRRARSPGPPEAPGFHRLRQVERALERA